jgi:hypothetical protein
MTAPVRAARITDDKSAIGHSLPHAVGKAPFYMIQNRGPGASIGASFVWGLLPAEHALGKKVTG